MPSQNAEIIDLKAYRDRRLAISSLKQGGLSAHPSFESTISPAAFMMPAAFFYFWPAWVMAPAFPIGAAASGHRAP